MPNNTYAYSEIFDSIQGEGEYTGYPTAWLRFYLCNLQCNGFSQDDPTDPSTYKLPYKDFDIIEIKDLKEFKEKCEMIVANRVTSEIKKFKGEIFTRDIFGVN